MVLALDFSVLLVVKRHISGIGLSHFTLTMFHDMLLLNDAWLHSLSNMMLEIIFGFSIMTLFLSVLPSSATVFRYGADVILSLSCNDCFTDVLRHVSLIPL